MNNWIKKDLKYIWHPYTQMKDCEKMPPILIEKAKGIKLYDTDGKYYYDTISSWWCNVHGHNHPKINRAIKEQLNKLEHVLLAGFTHKPAIELAERLVKITPKSLKKVFFSDNGSTAVEAAVKMSFQYWHNTGNRNKTKFITFNNGYHGDTVGTMSLSGVDLFNKLFIPLFFKTYKIQSPCHIKQLEILLKQKTNKICAIVIEPLLMAAGGMIVYPKEYLIKIAGLAKKYNVHLILDEVATGFGRTGKMFACQYTNIQPDFMCLSKGITAGYLPMGATLTTDKIYNAFYDDYEKNKSRSFLQQAQLFYKGSEKIRQERAEQATGFLEKGRDKTFFHGHTYTGNPLSCAAANASLEIFKKEKTLKNVKKLAPIFHKKLNGFKKYPFIKNIRYIGFVGAMDIISKRKRIGLEIYKEGLKQNLILRPLGNTIYLFLPLCVTKNDLNTIFTRMHKVFSRIKFK